jgi:N-acetylglucosaminyldiphosphoundecaprenol N-acetyl-beta-D-mannosaminyltransferase
MSPRIDVLGVHLNVLDLSAAVDEMDALIAAGQRGYVSTCPAYTVMLGHERSDVRAALNGATWATADGVPVAWAQRLLGGRGAQRVYGPDLMLALCARSAARGYRQFLLGGEPGVAADLATRLEARFPGLQTAGVLCPPFRALTPSEEEDIIAGLNAARADVVWVGLGSPKQDLWMARYRARLTAPLLIGVGAAFDFLTERKPQAPQALRAAGLEWLFRLLSEPRRLWRRYVIYNPKFVWGLARQWWQTRRRKVAGAA